MYCSKCGAQLPEGAAFCPGCGAAKETVNAPEKTAGKNKSVLILAIVGVLILLLVVAVVVVVLLGSVFQPGQPGKPNVQTDPSGIYTEPSAATLPQGSAGEDAGLPAENIYRECFARYEAYVLPNSDKSYYSRKELMGLSKEALTVAEQEIHARHGESFSDGDLQEYFTARRWYEPGAASYSLNEYEEMNLKLIDVHKRDLDGTLRRSDNPYVRYSAGADSYLLTGSDSRYLDALDLEGKEKDELVAARNEIYARYGYIFADHHLQELFLSKSWYQPKVKGADFDRSAMNKTEQNNIDFIRIYERIAEGPTYDSANPYIPYLSVKGYILPHSDKQDVDYYELEGMSLEELCLARNEILARHGYTFSSDELLDYFLQCSWYRPSTPIGDNGSIRLSAVENKNVDTIRYVENLLKNQPDLSKLDTRLTKTVESGKIRVNVPAYWKDYAVWDLRNDGGITFRERVSNEIGYGGHLFTLRAVDDLGENLYDESDDPDVYAYSGYNYLGTLTNSNGNKLYVIIYWPTDVQFSMTQQAIYSKMYAEQDRIIGQIEGVNGWTFAPA